MSNIVKAASKSIVKTDTFSGAAGKGMVAAGAGGLGLTALAALVPFVGLTGLCIVLIVLGLLMWE